MGRAVSVRQPKDFSGRSHGSVSAQGMNKLCEVRKQKRDNRPEDFREPEAPQGRAESLFWGIWELEMEDPLQGLLLEVSFSGPHRVWSLHGNPVGTSLRKK